MHPWLATLLVATAPPAPVVFALPGPLPAFVGAVDADPDGQQTGVIVGSSDAGVRVAVLDRDGRLVFLRDGVTAPAGALAVGRTRLAVAAPDDDHAPGAALRVWALSPARDRAVVIAARATPPLFRVPLGDVAAVAMDLSPDERAVAVAVTGLVDQRGAVVVVVNGALRRVSLPFAPTSIVFRDDRHIVVGGAGGTFTIDVDTLATTSTAGPPVTALAIVDGRVVFAHGPVAVAAGGALACVDGGPVLVDAAAGATARDDDALPCPRFGGGAVLVGATHGVDDAPMITVWR